MPPRRAHLLAALAGGMVLLLSLPGLGGPALLPEEAARVLDPHGPWRASFAIARVLHVSPEAAARLPAAIAAAAAAAAVSSAASAAGAGVAGLLAAGMSPVLVAAAGTAGPEAFSLLLGALALRVSRSPRPAARVIAAILLASAIAASIGRTLLPSPDRSLAATLGAWGLLFGPGLPPWRLDLALPALACAIPLLWLGSVGVWWQRALGSAAPFAAAALLGPLAPRATGAALAGAALTPWVLFAIARGSARLRDRRPARVAARVAALVAVSAGAIAAANLHLGRDVLDPARRVAWDEAARMLAVLAAEEGARVESTAPLPASLALYAPGGTLPPALGDGSARVLVVATGHLALDPSIPPGHSLRGEIAMGEIEPGLARLIAVLTARESAQHYLRIRRYERSE